MFLLLLLIHLTVYVSTLFFKLFLHYWEPKSSKISLYCLQFWKKCSTTLRTRLFKLFREGDNKLKDTLHFGRPSVLNVEASSVALETEPSWSTHYHMLILWSFPLNLLVLWHGNQRNLQYHESLPCEHNRESRYLHFCDYGKVDEAPNKMPYFGIL